MKTHTPAHRFLYILAVSVLLYSRGAFAQNEGIGTFSDLVGEARQTAPQPQPTPITVLVTKTSTGLKMFATPLPTATPSAPSFFSAPTVGLEYDYRRTQQMAPGGLTIDVNEAHTSFAFLLASTKLAFDFVHIWADGSNSIGNSQGISSNGIKLTLTQPIGDHLIFSLPLFYKKDDGDAITSTGPQTFGTDTFVMNPLLIVSFQPNILKDNQGQPKPAKDQPLTLSISPGYRLGVSQKGDIRPISPDVDGWTGTFNLLAGVEYAPKNDQGENKWKISGNATWNHLARFYSSKPGPRPDDNSFGLGATLAYNFLTFEGTHQARLAGKIGYQYDGFNLDSYQHSVTIAGTYRFW